MADPFVDAFNRAGEDGERWRWILRAPPARARMLLQAIPAAMAPPPELGEGARALQALARGLPAAENAQGVLTRQATRRLKHGRWPVVALAWSPDGRQLASAGGRALQLWDAASGACLRTMNPAAGQLNTVAWSPDGRLLAGWIERVSEELGYGNGIGLWDAAGGACPHTLSDVARPWSLRWLGDGQQLAHATTGDAIQVWNASTNARTPILKGHPWQEDHLEWSPDGRCLASLATDGTIVLWDLVCGARARTLEGHAGRISACAWSPDGRSLAAGAEETIQLWDASTGNRSHTLAGHGARITALAWSPDGRSLASASTDQTIRLWDRARGECSQILEGQQAMVHAIAFSADGRCLASASANGTILLWDGARGVCTHRLHRQPEGPSPVAWSPDGRTLAMSGGDQWIQLWRRDLHELAALFETPLDHFDRHNWNLVAACLRAWPPQEGAVLPWLRFISALGTVIRRFDVDVAEASAADDASAYAVILEG